MSNKPPGLFLFSIFLTSSIAAQQSDSLLTNADLQQCVQYALEHQPTVKQSLIDEEIVETYIKTRLADWYPQLNFDYSIQHYFEVQKSVFNGTTVNLSAKNYSAANFSLNQTIFNPDVLLARNTRSDVRSQVKQFTANNKIYTVLNVSKAFYDVLVTQQQAVLTDEDILRLDRSVKDAYNQYKAGIVDKTDYKRAQISLNNARAQKKQYEELLTAKYAVLKLLMGYPQQAPLDLIYDSVQLHNEIYIDTLQQVNYAARVEFRILQTQRSLLEANVKYYKWNYLPSVSAFVNYNINFFDNSFSKLFRQGFPFSYAGVALNFPIFEGGKRTQQIKGANLQLERLTYNYTSLRDSIQTEYAQALSAYKSNLNEYYVQRENVELAEDVYTTIQLQYRAGVKAYLDVIIAESDLRSTQVNYLNALYQVLSSKLDVQKALGEISYQ